MSGADWVPIAVAAAVPFGGALGLILVRLVSPAEAAGEAWAAYVRWTTRLLKVGTLAALEKLSRSAIPPTIAHRIT